MLILLLCELYHFWWFMFIAYAYVCRHKYMFYFAFICLLVFFLCVLNSLGLILCMNFTFLIYTWYVCDLRKRRHGCLENYRPLNMGCVCYFVLSYRYWGIVTVPGSVPYGSRPGMVGSSPSTLTTSLTILVPSSSSSNGPTTVTVTTMGLCRWPCDLRTVKSYDLAWYAK